MRLLEHSLNRSSLVNESIAGIALQRNIVMPYKQGVRGSIPCASTE